MSTWAVDPPTRLHLLRIDPAAIGSGGPAALADWARELERRYVRHVEVEGVVWQPLRSSPSIVEPDRYGSGGDSMLFTGVALSGWAWKYAATGDSDRLIEAVRGLWILTHVAGRGVLCRAAFPASRDVEFGWPGSWAGRDPRFVGETPAGAIPDPIRGGHLPAMRWYTRATRDQITGPRSRTLVRVGARDGPDDRSGALLAASPGRRADHHRRRRAPARTRMAHPRRQRAERHVCRRRRWPTAGGGAGSRPRGRDARTPIRTTSASSTDIVKRADPLGAFDRYNNVERVLRAQPARRPVVLDLAARRGPRARRADGRLRPSALETLDRSPRECVARLAVVRDGRHPPGRGGAARVARAPVEAEPALVLAAGRSVAAAQLQRGDPRYHGRVGASGLSAQAHGLFRLAEGAMGCRGRTRDTRGLGDSTGVDFLAAYWLGRAHGFI